MTMKYPHPPSRAGVLVQYLLPQHGLSRLVHYFTRLTRPAFKNALIRWFIARYAVDMSEAVESDPNTYASFNAFFTRALRADARPADPAPNACLSPVDGCVSQLDDIEDGRIFQAKGHDFSVSELLGGDAELAARFNGGRFATLYLAPRDYHRVHMPLAGTLERMIHVPGRLFSVNPVTTRSVPRLFARNERVAAIFDSPAGPMGLVLVGAMLVGSIETVWAGEVTPPRGRDIRRWYYDDESGIELARGAEMGRFNMGSTVIVLLPDNAVRWSPELRSDSRIRVGQTLGGTL